MSSFIELFRRASNIRRWNLHYQTDEEMLSTHCYEVAVVSHLLGTISKNIFENDICPDRLAALGVFHESSELKGGDVLASVKYDNPELTESMKKMESKMELLVLDSLPLELKEAYRPYIQQEDSTYYKILLKAADVICAYEKAHREVLMNNYEFNQAYTDMGHQVREFANKVPEVKYYCDRFLKLDTQHPESPDEKKSLLVTTHAGC